MKIKFNKDYLQVLAKFKAKKTDVRQYLQGLHVKPHPEQGVILTAADGHRLVVIYDKYGSADCEVILPISAALLSASKKAKSPCKLPLEEIQIVDGKAYVLHSSTYERGWFFEDCEINELAVAHVEYIKPIDGKYPNIKRVLDGIEFAPAQNFCVRPDYLGDLQSLGEYLSFGICGNDGKIVAVGGNDEEILAVVMPSVIGYELRKLPDFAKHCV